MRVTNGRDKIPFVYKARNKRTEWRTQIAAVCVKNLHVYESRMVIFSPSFSFFFLFHDSIAGQGTPLQNVQPDLPLGNPIESAAGKEKKGEGRGEGEGSGK